MNPKIKIAIIIGSLTASAGEDLAVSFIGKSNVKLIGEKTMGLITGNSGYPIREDITYFLSDSYLTDRTGKVYTKAIEPDVEIIGGDNFDDLLLDEKVIQSIKWILE